MTTPSSRFGWRQKRYLMVAHIFAHRHFLFRFLLFKNCVLFLIRYMTLFSPRIHFSIVRGAAPSQFTTLGSCTVKTIGNERSSVGWGVRAQRSVRVRSPRTSRHNFLQCCFGVQQTNGNFFLSSVVLLGRQKPSFIFLCVLRGTTAKK